MTATASSWSPEELVSQLASTVALRSVCIPAEVVALRPRLEAVARRCGSEITARVSGQEDLVCVTAAANEPTAVLAAIEHALSLFVTAPFLLLLPDPGAETYSAVVAARMFLVSQEGWLARDLPHATGPMLLAPLQRLLAADRLAGEWHTASGLGHLPEGRREADRLRMLILEERAWVGEQAIRLMASESWRIGHGLVRIARRLTFKGDADTDIARVIRDRMQNSDLP